METPKKSHKDLGFTKDEWLASLAGEAIERDEGKRPRLDALQSCHSIAEKFTLMDHTSLGPMYDVGWRSAANAIANQIKELMDK